MPPDTREIDVPSGRRLVHQLRKLIAGGGLGFMLVLALAPPAPADLLRLGSICALFLLCAWAVYHAVLRYVRNERQRQATLSEVARIEGASLAARTMRHHLGNKLAVAMGHSELLAEDPRLPHELEEHAQKIIASASAAIEAVDKLQDGIARVQLDNSVAGPQLLDVGASTSANPPATASSS